MSTLISERIDDWPPGLLRELFVTRIEPEFPQQPPCEPHWPMLGRLKAVVAEGYYDDDAKAA